MIRLVEGLKKQEKVISQEICHIPCFFRTLQEGFSRGSELVKHPWGCEIVIRSIASLDALTLKTQKLLNQGRKRGDDLLSSVFCLFFYRRRRLNCLMVQAS